MHTIWIVDGEYLMRSAPGRFDYARLKVELENINGEPFRESYYLNSAVNRQSEQQDKFYTWLKLAPPVGPKMRVFLYDVKELHCDCPNCGSAFNRTVQKGVDVGIATLLIKLAVIGKYDRVILSAGDGDFEDAIDYVKDELHKEVWVAGFNNTVSADIQSYSDRIVWIESIWGSIRKPFPSHNGHGAPAPVASFPASAPSASVPVQAPQDTSASVVQQPPAPPSPPASPVDSLPIEIFEPGGPPIDFPDDEED